MSTNLTTAEQLSSLASAVKGKLNVLDTLPSTVNGGLWLEGGGSVPIIKLYYGDDVFKITPELFQLLDPQLTLSTHDALGNPGGTSITIYVSYLGSGTLTAFSDNSDIRISEFYSPRNSSYTKAVDVSSSIPTNGTVTVSLSESPSYKATSDTCTVTFEGHIEPE